MIAFRLSAGFAVFLISASPVLAGQRTVEANLPDGRYAQSDHPRCGVSGPLTHLDDPEVVSAVASTTGSAKAAGVVFFIGYGASISEKSGGDLAGWINSLQGEDFSTCADMCIAAPPGRALSKIEWSDRDGGFGGVSLKKAIAGISAQSTKDHSGWRNFRAFQGADDEWIVCGTGTNWSGDQKALKRIRITYED